MVDVSGSTSLWGSGMNHPSFVIFHSQASTTWTKEKVFCTRAACPEPWKSFLTSQSSFSHRVIESSLERGYDRCFEYGCWDTRSFQHAHVSAWLNCRRTSRRRRRKESERRNKERTFILFFLSNHWHFAQNFFSSFFFFFVCLLPYLSFIASYFFLKSISWSQLLIPLIPFNPLPSDEVSVSFLTIFPHSSYPISWVFFFLSLSSYSL